MRAVSLNDPDLARGAAESDQVLSEKPQLYRRPIALHDLLFEQRWSPKTPQQILHRGARPNAGQHVVVLLRQHNATSLIRFHAESHASCRPHAPAWRFDTKPISRFVQAWPTACLSPRHTVNVQCQPLHALNGNDELIRSTKDFRFQRAGTALDSELIGVGNPDACPCC